MIFYDIDEYDFITNMSPKELDRFEDFLYEEDDRAKYLKFLHNFKQLPCGEDFLSYFKEKEMTEIEKEILIFYLSTIKDFYSGRLGDVTTYLHHLEECGLDVDKIFDENFSMLYEWLENEAFELGHDTIYDFLYETAKIDLDKDFFIKSALQPISVDKDDRKYLQNFIVSAYLYSNSHIISELDSEEFFEYSNNKNLQEQRDLFLENLRQDNLSEKDFYCKEAIENALKLGIESALFRKEEACDGLLKIVYDELENFDSDYTEDTPREIDLNFIIKNKILDEARGELKSLQALGDVYFSSSEIDEDTIINNFEANDIVCDALDKEIKENILNNQDSYSKPTLSFLNLYLSRYKGWPSYEEYKEGILINAQNDENKNINLRKQR